MNRLDEQSDGFFIAGLDAAVGARHFGEHRRIRVRHLVGVGHHRASRGQGTGLRLPSLGVDQLEAVCGGLHLVVGNLRVLGVAQPALVHKTEMRHVQKVFNNARCAGVHQIRPGVEFAQTRLRFGIESWQVMTIG